MTPDEESKLNVWLKRILPQVEEELNYGVTFVESVHRMSTLNIVKHQTLDPKSTNVTKDDASVE